MANCSDNTYYIYFTDQALGTIAIPKSALDESSLDITLLGKTRLEYGEVFNENLLHMLENFAAPSIEDSGEFIPDSGELFANLLQNPVIGQFWYDKTNRVLNICVNNDPIEWRPIEDSKQIAGSSGFISNAETIPLPVAYDGYEFVQSECVWHVSPSFLNTNGSTITGFTVEAPNRLVTATYTTLADGVKYGLANFIIIGVKDQTTPVVVNVPCPSPTITPTISLTPSITPTITVTPSVTPSSGAPITPTPTVTPTRTVTRSPTPTRTATVSTTPGLSASITPTATPTPTPTPTPSAVGEVYLEGGSITAYHPVLFPGTASATYILNPSGEGYRASTQTGSESFTWLNVGSPADYEVMATETYIENYGGTTEGDALDTWLNMSTLRYWSAEAAGANDEIHWHINVQVRRVSDEVVIASVPVFMHAAKGPLH